MEIVEAAVADAIENARRNEVTNARFYAGDVRLAMRDLVEQAGRPDVIVIDPPRAGLSQKVVRRIIEAAPKRIVYVSCNPTTLAPNAAQLAEAGWTLTPRAPRRHVPADAAHRVRRAAGALLTGRGGRAGQSASGANVLRSRSFGVRFATASKS